MGFSTSTCTEFVEVLASKAPVPGGGGASALVGAVGTALGNMVGSLTVGKKKYADVEDEMWELKAKCDQLQKDFLRLIERDAEVFEPLSKAYGMPRETEEEKAEKARVMEIVLKDACSVPMEIMEKCCEAIDHRVCCQRIQTGDQRCRCWGSFLQSSITGCKPERIHQYEIYGKQRIC